MSRERVRKHERKFIRPGEWSREDSRRVGPRVAAAKPGVEDFNWTHTPIEVAPVAAKRNRNNERYVIRNPRKLP
jgi:hypothetical protein